MILLATDLDGTFLGGKQIDKLNLYRHIQQNSAIKLVFVTGRGLESVLPLLNDHIIPNPDYIICDVGATIVDGKTLEPIEPLHSEIEAKWTNFYELKAELSVIKGMEFQEVPQQRRCSFYYTEETDLDSVYKIADKYQCDVITSVDKYLDLIPRNVNKGSTIEKLIEHLEVGRDDVLVAGDTLNDLAMYETGLQGVVVGSSEKLLVEKTKNMKNVYQAKATGAGGIIEALNHFSGFSDFAPTKNIQLSSDLQKQRQLLVVYHRLPFDLIKEDGEIKRIPPKSPNGVIPSLLGLFEKGRVGVWVGEQETEKLDGAVSNQYIDEEKYPNLTASIIPLSKKDIDRFYRGFSKEAFWPVIFSFVDKAHFDHADWEHFLKINETFAQRVAKEADEGAMVWVHDYNLWMVPAYLKTLRPDIRIAFFHHTSFPPADIFNTIPWRKEIIGSLLQCDFISFHIPRYVENFVDVLRSHTPFKVLSRVNAAKQFLTYSLALGVDKMTKVIEVSGRKIRLGAQPVGISVDKINNILEEESSKNKIEQLKKDTEGKTIILSVERLDYVKGPLEKIRAYGEFLEEHPEYHGKIELINISTPPSKGMNVYDTVQKEIEQAVGEINGKFSTLDWVPIQYFFRVFPFNEVLAYYAVADIAWITPLRDGLNLVAKEYVGVKGKYSSSDGVLILSEFAGASVEMPYAVFTNPYDIQSLKEGLLQALTMEEEDKQLRMKRLYEAVSFYNIEYWGRDFIREFNKTLA